MGKSEFQATVYCGVYEEEINIDIVIWFYDTLPGMTLLDIQQKIESLSLSVGEYCVVAGGAMTLQGLRDSDDLDILVTPETFARLQATSRYTRIEKNGYPFLIADSIEIFTELPLDCPLDSNDVIQKSENKSGVQCMSLSDLYNFKKYLDRDKDMRDIILIKQNKVSYE